MSQIILSDCFISIDGEEYSGQGTNVAISMSAETSDVTTFGQNTRHHLGSVKDWSIALEFIGDEEVTGAFFEKLGTEVEIEIRATSAPRSAKNPAYVGQAVITEYTPIDGAVGDALTVSLSLVSASELERLTTAA